MDIQPMSADQTNSCLDRRSLLHMSGSIAMTVALLLSGSAGGMLSGCSAQNATTPHSEAILTALADILLPATRSPSAGTPDNVAFMMRAIQSNLLGIRGDTLDRLTAHLDQEASASFLNLQPQARIDLVEKLDERVFSHPQPQTHPWYTIKTLILMAYYTSQIGMTAELHYDIVPGDFVPDQVIDAAWRAPAGDWSAVSIKKPVHS